MADLRGIARVPRRWPPAALPVADAARAARPRAAASPAGVPRGLVGQLVRFAVVGVLSTLAYLLLFVLLRAAIGAQAANLVALLLTAVANTAANRRFTFGVRGGDGAARHQLRAWSCSPSAWR